MVVITPVKEKPLGTTTKVRSTLLWVRSTKKVRKRKQLTKKCLREKMLTKRLTVSFEAVNDTQH